ncbi:hypothetical protein U2F26_20810 [Micromonospora sp. 4G57]|uniref:HEAT repeat domain-containing protein n=1 Tax=Micromonospora sicca TaxID=2202420 RepID=A0ABU5JEE7_9ACTN|nr:MULTISPECIES: hypothetical protein [unclassified Micromonospora]MDZ5445145.1 hypothetical protein [Micromonospora sp. 4G57]MDZ5490978.1 hypothetical protein [Micromonospora sp. 4G53]
MQQGRAAWLLRVNRLYGPNEQWQRGAVFAEAFQGGCWPERTSVYRISRWETATVRVPYLAVRRYEELLDLPANGLVALLDAIYRYSAATVGNALQLDRGLREGSPHQAARLEELLEAARSEDVLTGSDWDELTSYLAFAPRQMITPRSAWTDIAERLLAEMIVADGVAWMQRYEALNRLLAHPVGQQHAVAACASLAADRTNQVFVETVSALDASAHPDASRHVLDQLMHPTNDRAQYGALLASIRKLRYGHFSEPQLRRLVPVVNELALDPARYEDAQPLAAELLRRLPTDVPAAAKARLRHVVIGDPTLNQVLPASRLAAAEAGQILIARITNTAMANMPRDVPNFHDELLPVLLDEMFFSPVFDVRLCAAILLFGTPYRRPLAVALALELGKHAASFSVDVAHAMIEALRILGDEKQRPIIERLTTASGVPPPITVAATQAIGHLGGSSEDRYWKSAVNHHAHLWDRTRNKTSASALSALIYGLGVAHNTALLQHVRENHQAPAMARAAASWWLNLPRTVYESATQ